LESCLRVKVNSTLRTPSRCWISALSPSSSAALLDQSPEDVYTPDVCNISEVLHLRHFIFIDLFDYTTLRLASVVFIGNICART
jgi:hypothetical protein